jgi:chromate transporter
MRGINAAVVGLLGAALYSPIGTSTITGPVDLALALVGFVLLTAWRSPPLLVVAVVVAANLGLSQIIR